MKCRVTGCKKLSVFSDPTETLKPKDFLQKDTVVTAYPEKTLYGKNDRLYIKIKYNEYSEGYVYTEGLEGIETDEHNTQ